MNRRCRVKFTREFLLELTANELAAYANAMAPFIVIDAKYDTASDVYEQILYDPIGDKLAEVPYGTVIPEYQIIFRYAIGGLVRAELKEI